MDERVKTLAKNLVNYSCRVKAGDKVYINYTGPSTEDLARQLVKEVYAAGGLPFAHYINPKVQREILMNCTEEQIKLMADLAAQEMSQMDCYIGVRGSDNVSELSDVPADKMNLYETLYSTPVHHGIRVPKTRWVVLRYPNASMAQLSGTSSEAFEDFYFQVCNLDYSKMSRAMKALVELMNRTDKVRLTGRDTDLTFSIKDIPAIACDGQLNIPDGEVYTAPVRDSINGVITYNTPSLYQGFTFENVRLEFENGKIVKATANNTERLNQILDTDEGARPGRKARGAFAQREQKRARRLPFGAGAGGRGSGHDPERGVRRRRDLFRRPSDSQERPLRAAGAGLPEPGEPGVGQYSRQQVRTHILLQKGYFYESL